MQSRQAQVVVCRSNHSPQDRRLSDGLFPHLEWLTQQGIDVWDSACITAGLNVVEETKQAVTLAQIAILLVSIDFLNDPLIKEVEPLLLYLARNCGLHLIPILLRPCLYSSSAFVDFPFVNSKPIADMRSVKREETWECVCSRICDILGVQPLPPSLNSLFTEQYLRDLYVTFTKHRNLQVSLFTGSANGTLNHGLRAKPDRVLLASGHGQEIVYDQVGSSQVHVLATSASVFTGLAIARARNDEVDRFDSDQQAAFTA